MIQAEDVPEFVERDAAQIVERAAAAGASQASPKRVPASAAVEQDAVETRGSTV
jgi:hypothetical protein